MFLPSNAAERSSIGVEPEASTTCFAVSSRCVPSCAVNFTFLPGQQLAVPLQRRDARGLEQREDAAASCP